MSEEQIEERVKKTYPKSSVAVLDLTGNQNHFELRVSEKTLEDKSKIEQHRTLMSLFEEELRSGKIHALRIKVVKGS